MDLATAQVIFENVRGTRFVGIDALTDVALMGGKKNPMKGRVTKRTTGATVMVFAQAERGAYSAQVKRRMEKEGLDPTSWDSKPLSYGHWMDDSVFIEHTKKDDDAPTHYLRVHFVHAGTSEYFLDGKPIKKSDIEGLPVRKDNGKQGGQEEKVIPRNYKLDSLTSIRIDGSEFIV